MSSFENARDFVAMWGTVYFGLIFLATLVYALAPWKKADFERAAAIPLRED
jgi:cytochrome c oxidase cbb3-type subunit 4